ncbi:hypothetical protein HJG60_009049 [Phyllostomus discolor]|uniref:Uncharacterized protein n=1 Tax=Phyllostomus discolor TaxID=89673 RepID=A0A833YM41_9CHIR|nr:hypothetical protein HJG60_009049 [Phyllostomus discolor]
MGGHPPGRRGRGCPQIPPPAAPLTTLPPSPGPSVPSPSPAPGTHSSPPSLLHAPLHACLPLSPPWATILHKFALSLSCTFCLRFRPVRPSQLCFPRTLGIAFPTLHAPCSLQLSLTRSSLGVYPVTPHFRKSLGPCCRHTWDTLSLTHSQALCTHSFCGIPFSSFNPCTLAIHALLRTRLTAFSLSTFLSYS